MNIVMLPASVVMRLIKVVMSGMNVVTGPKLVSRAADAR